MSNPENDAIDAARYRWLRDKANGCKITAPLCWHTTPKGEVAQVADGADLDHAIDYAIAASITGADHE